MATLRECDQHGKHHDVDAIVEERLSGDHQLQVFRRSGAGSCRVVLAIKPGYEEEVISLLDEGAVGPLAAASRFRKVVNQVVAAEARFAAHGAASTAPPDNDDEDTNDVVEPPASHDTLIGQWSEWTPTSAIDMEVTLRELL